MIHVQQLNKSFNGLTAVNNLSFEVQPGEIFGLLGPNGAGKSTTLNMLSGIVAADSGQIKMNGFDLKTQLQQLKLSIGVVPQEISLYDEFSAVDNLRFWGGLYKVPKAQLNDNIEKVLSLIGLSERQNDLLKTYSGGMKRRINIAAAILHNPQVLLLDEPTVGVDPQSRNRIFEIVETLNKKGMTIIYTSHYMEEVERLCDRIAIMDQGEIIAQGSQDSLKANSQIKEVVEIECNAIDQNQLKQLRQIIKLDIELKDNQLRILGTSNEQLGGIIQAVNDAKVDIKGLEIKKVNLERVFLALTGKQLRD